MYTVISIFTRSPNTRRLPINKLKSPGSSPSETRWFRLALNLDRACRSDWAPTTGRDLLPGDKHSGILLQYSHGDRNSILFDLRVGTRTPLDTKKTCEAGIPACDTASGRFESLSGIACRARKSDLAEGAPNLAYLTHTRSLTRSAACQTLLNRYLFVFSLGSCQPCFISIISCYVRDMLALPR